MLPQLNNFNWYIDMKLAPNHDITGGQRTQSSCILCLYVKDSMKNSSSNQEERSTQETLQIELSKETLLLVLDNFTRIRDQLNVLAKKAPSS
ncbi:unnamed protein product [Didymodactylos carnosus]|uniref:COMM domain-containing protein n=1 Tax=Didymodactylos carnosus TaxID=1234261 RepID=A0A814DBS4_9BILA|nr:unnamed protein product [Didymodactylos carnosus]CAF0951553.1 unnamed protein product [Didymodactylos carnosus]CAF3630784.1 unnamed protein product [Didymodactylos carnosus]CAF3727193.1 unnamed protein product [Didymodactylos carnosus]